MSSACAQAFQKAGLDIWGDDQTVVSHIQSSDIRPQLVMALDHGALVADSQHDKELMGRLLRLARQVDPDPKWGDRFRDPTVWGDRERMKLLEAE